MSKTTQLLQGWELTSTDANQYSGPLDLKTKELAWISALVPGTVAESLGISIDQKVNLDNRDWWYRSQFSINKILEGEIYRLNFEGLATLAFVWLNGELILDSKNMFVGHICDVTHLLKMDNELIILFRSVDQELLNKKPRPRWKTGLVKQQNLRFIRTTLLGRIPGWSPVIQAIGPWKNITLQKIEEILIEVTCLQTKVEGSLGIVEIEATIQYLGNERIQSAKLFIGKQAYLLFIKCNNHQSSKIESRIEIENISLWWPHTHGAQKLYDCRIEIQSDRRNFSIDCKRIGFKNLELNRENGLVQFKINNKIIFCRGACWTVNDFISLVGSQSDLLKTLHLAVACGLNMFRIGGTMIYESDDFYRLCDELGILVWQDFMFANMDYPVNDPDFKIEIEKEVIWQLNRFQRHVCITVYCGGSEVQQQAAMMGLPKTEWSNEFFDLLLPQFIQKYHLGIPYFPSSPCEGALPFHVSEGITHYYGVGAYRRDLADVKLAKVKFTPECLGFSNVPELETMNLLAEGNIPAAHSPIWKSRIPRDSGAGWDFEDIRDFYLKKLFQIDPIELRSQDTNRYYEISRVVSGEVIKSVFSEWRKPGSLCNGALIWFYKDLWPGAGWGIIDSKGNPKAVWYNLKNIWSTQVVLITDEGLDGLQIHVLNETQKPLKGILGLELFTHQKNRSENITLPIEIAANGTLSFHSDSLLGHFTDVSSSYRFGPAKYDVVRAYLKSSDSDKILSEDFYFPIGMNLPINETNIINISAEHLNFNLVEVTLISTTFLQSVHLTSLGFFAEDNYFHLAPNTSKRIRFRSIEDKKRSQFKVELTALNLRESVICRSTISVEMEA